MNFSNSIVFNALLNMLNFSIFVLDEKRRPLFVNAKAGRLMNEGEVFYTDSTGSLRITDDATDKTLKRSLNALYHDEIEPKIHPIPIRFEETRPVMFAWVSSLPLPGNGARPKARRPLKMASLMITEKSHQKIEKDILANLFNLTPAEARLLQCLLEGTRPLDYAKRQGVSQNTVRNQLKSIFEKTEVRRQSDLVSLVLTSVAPLNFAVPEEY